MGGLSALLEFDDRLLALILDLRLSSCFFNRQALLSLPLPDGLLFLVLDELGLSQSRCRFTPLCRHILIKRLDAGADGFVEALLVSTCIPCIEPFTLRLTDRLILAGFTSRAVL